MGRGDKKRESGRGKQVRKDGKGKAKGEGPKFVPKFEYFAKSKLAAYPSEEGKCVYTEKNHGEKDFFKLKNILKTRNSGNEELCRRIGMGLALDAASAHHGVEVLQKHFADAVHAVPGEHAARLGKTGLPKLLEELGSDRGKRFVHCLAILNVGKSGQPAESDVKAAVKTFVEYLQDPNGNLHRHLTRLATDAAGLYPFAMTLLKDMALVQDPEGWAVKVEGKQREAVKAWKRRPADEKKLRHALVAELMAKVENNEPAPGKKRRVSDSSSASGGAGSSKGGASSQEASGEDSDGSAESESKTSSGKSSEKSSSPSSSSSAAEKDRSKKKDKDKKKGAKEKKTKWKKGTTNTKEEKDKKSNKEDKKLEAKGKKNAREEEADTKEKKSKKPSKGGKEKKTKGEAVSLDSEADVIESSSQNEKRHSKDKKTEKSKKAERKQKEKELQAEKRREKKEAGRAAAAAAEAEEAARTAAFTTWPASTVQEAAEQLEDAKASIGLLTGRFKKEDLVNLTRLIPTQVLARFPEVCIATADLAHVDGEWVSNKEAKPALVMLLEVASAVAAFWAEHAETASPSGEAATGPEAKEKEEKKEG